MYFFGELHVFAKDFFVKYYAWEIFGDFFWCNQVFDEMLLCGN